MISQSKPRPKRTAHQGGYSLVGFSVALIVLSIIMTMSFTSLDYNARKRRANETNEKMDRIERAVALYMARYNHLPCPSGYTYEMSSTNFGKQTKTVDNLYTGAVDQLTDGDACDKNANIAGCRCKIDTSELASDEELLFADLDSGFTMVTGMVPVRDLGLPDEDAMDGWNNRIMYTTVDHYSRNFSNSTFSDRRWLTQAYNMDGKWNNQPAPEINVRSIGSSDTDGKHYHSRDKPAYLLISYGGRNTPAINRRGNIARGSFFPCAASDDPKFENCDNDKNFIADISRNETDTSREFDNIVRKKVVGQVAREAKMITKDLGNDLSGPNNIGQMFMSNDEVNFKRHASDLPFVDANMAIRRYPGAFAIDGMNVYIDTGFDEDEDELRISGSSSSTAGDIITYSGGVVPSGIDVQYDKSNGVLNMKLASGISSGTYEDYVWQSIVNHVQFYNDSVNNTSDTTSTLTRVIQISLGEHLGFIIDDKAHYYEFVSSNGIEWIDAKTGAENKSFFGMSGYLAEITTSEENDFIKNQLRQSDGTIPRGWIGARRKSTDTSNRNSSDYRTWIWDGGPGSGTVFWSGNESGSAVSGRFNSWAFEEPNDGGSGEPYAHFKQDGNWNDLPVGGSSNPSSQYYIQGYVVEYGGFDNDPNTSVVKSVTVNIVPA